MRQPSFPSDAKGEGYFVNLYDGLFCPCINNDAFTGLVGFKVNTIFQAFGDPITDIRAF